MRFGYLLLAVLTLCLALFAYRHPTPTFDRYLYAATVASLHTHDAKEIGREAMLTATPGSVPHNAVADEIMANPELMALRIPFFAVKPLYILLLKISGFRLISPLAFIGLAILLVLWLRNPWWCIPLLLLPDVVLSAKTITPDLLSAALVVGAFLAIWRGRAMLGILILLLSITVRTDNILFLLPALVVLDLEAVIAWPRMLFFAITGVLLVLGINHFAHSYGWSILVRYSVPGAIYQHARYVGADPVTPKFYASLLLHGGLDGAIGMYFSLWLMIGAYTWLKFPAMRGMLAVALFYAVTHLALYPFSESRYFIGAYLLVGISFIAGICGAKPQLDRKSELLS